MAEQYMVGVIGGVIASLLGSVFLYCNSLIRFRGQRKLNRAASMEFPKKNSVNKTGSEGVGTADIIIVGAGVAGAALAYSLGKDGRRVRAIERDLNAPNSMAGESLIPGGYLKLIELGLEDCVDEIGAQRLLGYTLYKDGKEAHVSFPLEKSQSHVAGRTFHNGRFVQSLRKKVASLHNEQVPSVSNGEMACYLKTQVAPKVLPELYDSFISAIEKKGNIRISPNKIMAAAPHLTPGALLIGDALNMRHAITGGGMTVALSDVVILRDLIRPLHDLSDAFTVSKYLESFYTLRKPMSSTINILANVLQKIFSASSNPAMENLQHTFLGYMRLGGMFSYGASAMLCGLCPRPLSLAFHFLFIAMYGVGRLLLPFPSPKRLWDGAKLLWVASSILLPYIYSEGIRQMFFPLTVPAYYRTPPKKSPKKSFMH
ncbi:hypothetical protein E1A91_A04G164800v1 [Gossypium mustelinum]|uniref:Squalene monooxygenase n=1 Tax=Gossypium mustelinum TaxID=34275 RepID=A0A5D2ZRU0_GOSMU|nr:hypothetical protein E1A91_A04G164800v1 [Gossypium mustelinum]